MMNIKGNILVLMLSYSLSGCSMFLTGMGAATTTVETAQGVDTVKLAVDAGLAIETKKTVTDHVVSKVRDKDCSTLNTFLGEDYCKDKVEEQRYTGFTCGTTAYSDWPCMDAKGCMVK